MDLFAALATYATPKAVAAAASKVGATKVALAVGAVAPTIMSFTFYSAVSEQVPRLASLFIIPQVGFSVLSLASLGPNAFVLKNLLLPSMASLAAYFGWVPEALLPNWWVTYVKQCGIAAIAALVVCHVLYCGRAVAVRMVYPAPIISNIMDLSAMRMKAVKRPGITRHSVPSSKASGVTLDTLMFTAFDQQQQQQQQQTTRTFPRAYIVYVGGNGEVAEVSIDTVRTYAQHLGANGVVFNPRGVGESGGVAVTTAGELVDDLLDVVQFLMRERGAREQDIVLFGHSIGGGLSGEVVAKHHPRVSVVFDRTFSSLFDAARSMMPALPQTLVRHGLPLFFGEFPNGENWKKIQHDRKAVSFHREDQIIKYGKASLARLDNFLQEDSKFLVELTGRSADPHNTPSEFFMAGHLEILKRMEDFLTRAQSEAK